MKRTFSIGLALLLVLSTIGVTVNKHYSAGELYSVALFGEADSCCEVDCDCCHEESETYQVKDEFISSSFDLAKVYFTEAITLLYEKLVQDLFGTDKTQACLEQDKSPPPEQCGEEYTQVFLL
ncbi:MAG: hypothetical protein K9G58_13300 [Bacteroidales bacterium]|nr:hypothetical protein [Bacteroidales bacterium]MCF8387572.1 hypothetical protein [Bacteroidales bacterium]MCF8399146.1 hypothetical protein [Bacteroidales bacterium]